MARSVKDIALMLDVTAQTSASVREQSFSTDLDRGLKGIRVGFVRQFHENDFVADPEVSAALAQAADLMQQEGAYVTDVRLPRLQHMAAVQRIILLAEAWVVHAKWLRERPADYSTPTRRKVMPGAFLNAGDYVQAQQWRRVIIEAVDDAFRDVDVLLTASGMDPPFRIDDAAGLARTYPRQARSPFNLTGHPALAMMSGLSKSGLPLSLQLVGRSFEEATLLRVARGYERASPWASYHQAIEGEPSPESEKQTQ
jgi:aspartyl-tRNA(Asn)/glutamyl-tRNA(Gln) amidotransferase subunit A